MASINYSSGSFSTVQVNGSVLNTIGSPDAWYVSPTNDAIETDHYLAAYLHEACGNVAFYLVKEPVEAELIKSENFLLLDGTQPKSGDVQLCGSCGEQIGRLKMDRLSILLKRKARVSRTEMMNPDLTRLDWKY